LGQDDLYKVDVMDSFSFFNVDEEHKERVEQTFEDFKMNGRRVSVEISKDGGRRSYKGGKGRKNFKKDRGGFKGKRRGHGDKPWGGGDRFGDKFKGRSRGRDNAENNSGTGGRRRRR
ncbi:MAG: DbpA RNA binding domain-containing protein, partial [Marinirhabdus sp.]